jgi:hypothetical protein
VTHHMNPKKRINNLLLWEVIKYSVIMTTVFVLAYVYKSKGEPVFNKNFVFQFLAFLVVSIIVGLFAGRRRIKKTKR